MLTPWFDSDNLFAELDALRRQLREFGGMPSMFDEELAPPGRPRIEEQDGATVLHMDMPGVAPEDLEVECAGHQLRIRAERKVEPPSGARVHHRERRAWRFDRTLNLPESIDTDKVDAALHHGVLTVTMPHRPETRPRRIAVTTG